MSAVCRVVCVAMVMAVAAPMAAIGCGANGVNGPGPARPQELTGTAARMFELNEAGLAGELPPPLADEELLIEDYRLERRQYAEQLQERAAAAGAVLAVAASLFAVTELEDVVLALVPWDEVARLGDAIRRGRKLFRARGKQDPDPGADPGRARGPL